MLQLHRSPFMPNSFSAFGFYPSWSDLPVFPVVYSCISGQKSSLFWTAYKKINNSCFLLASYTNCCMDCFYPFPSFLLVSASYWAVSQSLFIFIFWHSISINCLVGFELVIPHFSLPSSWVYKYIPLYLTFRLLSDFLTILALWICSPFLFHNSNPISCIIVWP